MRQPTDADYITAERIIAYKLLIYFPSGTLEVTESNYLITFNSLKEIGTESVLPFGSVSGNEIDFILYGADNIFNPSNTAGPYFNEMVVGLKIDVQTQPVCDEEVDWIKSGTFYVTDWIANKSDYTASVTASCIVSNLIQTSTANLSLLSSISFKNYFSYLFGAVAMRSSIDELNTIVPYLYPLVDMRSLLNELAVGSLSSIFSDDEGYIRVESMFKIRDLRDTLTDTTQIYSVVSNETLLEKYNGLKLSYVSPQVIKDALVASDENLVLPYNVTILDLIKFNNAPVVNVSCVDVSENSNYVSVSTFSHNAQEISITLLNTNIADVACKLNVYGSYIELLSKVLFIGSTNTLDISNQFIQTVSYAKTCFGLLQNFVNVPVQSLVVNIRGNGLYKLGDKIRVLSDKYQTDFTGVIFRIKDSYTDGLSSELTLINSAIFERGI
jgi:hypothetical protein